MIPCAKAAAEGITRGSENGDQCTEGQAQQGQGTLNEAMHLVAFIKEKLSQVGVILTGTTGDQSSRHKQQLSFRHGVVMASL